jgi:hypothetical protein
MPARCQRSVKGALCPQEHAVLRLPGAAVAAAADEHSSTAAQELAALAWAPAGCPPTLLTATAQVLLSGSPVLP